VQEGEIRVVRCTRTGINWERDSERMLRLGVLGILQ
jgi:hypothetical protein